MVASLDQFRRQFPPLTSIEGIQEYLKEHLSVLGEKMIGDFKWTPAAALDAEK